MANGESEDEEARKARAARLREQIARLKPSGTAAANETEEDPGAGQGSGDTAAGGTPPGGTKRESPRDFIHRRMRELEEEEGEKE